MEKEKRLKRDDKRKREPQGDDIGTTKERLRNKPTTLDFMRTYHGYGVDLGWTPIQQNQGF